MAGVYYFCKNIRKAWRDREELRFATCVRCGGPYVFASDGALICATVVSEFELMTKSKAQLREVVKYKLEMAMENIMMKVEEARTKGKYFDYVVEDDLEG